MRNAVIAFALLAISGCATSPGVGQRDAAGNPSWRGSLRRSGRRSCPEAPVRLSVATLVALSQQGEPRSDHPPLLPDRHPPQAHGGAARGAARGRRRPARARLHRQRGVGRGADRRDHGAGRSGGAGAARIRPRGVRDVVGRLSRLRWLLGARVYPYAGYGWPRRQRLVRRDRPGLLGARMLPLSVWLVQRALHRR